MSVNVSLGSNRMRLEKIFELEKIMNKKSCKVYQYKEQTISMVKVQNNHQRTGGMKKSASL